MITRQDAMRLWRKHGGSQHGPRVETVTMPLNQFHDFVADLINAALPVERSDLAPLRLKWRQEMVNDMAGAIETLNLSDSKLEIAKAILRAAIRAHNNATSDEAPAETKSSPYPIGPLTNCKRAGWDAYFAGRGRENCPFPLGRADLQAGYREGWDTAALQSELASLTHGEERKGGGDE